MAGLLRLITIIKDLTPIINQIDPWVRKIGGAGFFIIAVNLSMSLATVADKVTKIEEVLQTLTISQAQQAERYQIQKELILDHTNDLKQLNHRVFLIEKHPKQ